LKPDFSYTFKVRLFEAEEADKTQAESQSDLEKVLTKSPKVANALMALLTSQSSLNSKAQEEIRDVVSDIKVITYRPTTFRIIFKNTNYFDLIYDPSPLEVRNEKDYKAIDFFRVAIKGKRYYLSNGSDFEQALDYICQCMKSNPIDSNNPDEQQAATSGGEESGAAGTEDLPTETDKPKK
jgi:hypothetical protein